VSWVRDRNGCEIAIAARARARSAWPEAAREQIEKAYLLHSGLCFAAEWQAMCARAPRLARKSAETINKKHAV
jgi:hypothetical protein